MEKQAIGGYGVPLEISLHLLVRETKVDEYQPLKWASDANRGFHFGLTLLTKPI